MRSIFPREGTESGSIRNLTSSWSCPALPLLQTCATGLIKSPGSPRLTGFRAELCWEGCIWVRMRYTPGFPNLQSENDSINPYFTGLLCKHDIGKDCALAAVLPRLQAAVRQTRACENRRKSERVTQVRSRQRRRRRSSALYLLRLAPGLWTPPLPPGQAPARSTPCRVWGGSGLWP